MKVIISYNNTFVLKTPTCVVKHVSEYKYTVYLIRKDTES